MTHHSVPPNDRLNVPAVSREDIKAAMYEAVDETLEMLWPLLGIPNVDARDRDRTERRGLTTLGYYSRPGGGTTYLFDLEGREIQVGVTAKRKHVRVFVDGDEWKKSDQ